MSMHPHPAPAPERGDRPHPVRRAWRNPAVALLLLLLALAGCSRPAAPARGDGRHEAITVTVATVTNAVWEDSIPVVGTVFAKDEALLSARVEGQVERTLVDFGDRVRSDDTLALIDTAGYQNQVEQAEGAHARAIASQENARLNFTRVESLRKDNVASASDYDQAVAQLHQWEADVKASGAALEQAKLNLTYSKVNAPFDGAISQRFVGRGDYVKIGTPLFNLVNDAVLKFIFPVPERYASRVTKRLPVSFEVDNYPGETFTGSVYLISPAVTTTSRAFSVGALVTNLTYKLKANTFARGFLRLGEGSPTPVVPLEAVVSVAGVTTLFVADGSVAHSRPVRTGRVRGTLQEILEGVRPDEQVILTGQSRLVEGSAIALQSPAGTAPAARPGGPSATTPPDKESREPKR